MERYWVANGILASNECGGLVKYDDAQRALDAEREKVRRLSTCGTDHSTPWWQVKCEDLEATLQADNECKDSLIETLQAQLADRDAMILQMGEQAAVLAKENMAVKAQLRQVEGERDAADAELHRNMVEYCQFAHEIALPGTRLPEQVDDSISFGKLKDVVNAIVASRDTLWQLVAQLPVLDMRFDSVAVGPLGWTVGGVTFGRVTEANAYSALLQYRATLAAKDAGAKLPAWVNEAMRLAPTQTNAPHPTEERHE